MQSINTIKRRIHSIETIKKITTAMKLIASIKLKKQKKELTNVTLFCKNFYDFFSCLLDENLVDPKHHDKRWKFDNNLYIVITSSLGLCGSYNNTICRTIKMILKPHDHVIMIGQKGKKYFKNNNLNEFLIKFIDLSQEKDNIYDLFLALSYWCLNEYDKRKYKNIKIIYTKFISAFKTEIQIIDFFSFGEKKIGNKKTRHNKIFLFDSSRELIFKKILPYYFACLLYGSFNEAKISENVSRSNTMDLAAKNAKDLINNLKLQFNKLRQNVITKQISEVMSNIEAER